MFLLLLCFQMSKIGIGDSAQKAQDVGGGAGAADATGSNIQLQPEEEEEEEEEEDEEHVLRAIFEENLRKAGLETELEPSRVREMKQHREVIVLGHALAFVGMKS